MTDIKPWWRSRTLWGAIVTLAASALGLAGIDLGDADREALIDLLSALGATLGGLVAIIGRLAAKHRIG
ncbi:hypothetical protein PZ897_03670 [Hoeflea sp. YIM 152468]|uniref:hypothetical protein n=1 Tax=Hoeflea sp. YIM 152468 TaxID=3031759 RepID=UPI0023DAE567|nr:hypothetical protein [Hoeflea sp. YIM 152468]MDF1607270.1 hypothetical protein [Hoeflea sp. YIM 152468]